MNGERAGDVPTVWWTGRFGTADRCCPANQAKFHGPPRKTLTFRHRASFILGQAFR